jgi:hypothetical protein
MNQYQAHVSDIPNMTTVFKTVFTKDVADRFKQVYALMYKITDEGDIEYRYRGRHIEYYIKVYKTDPVTRRILNKNMFTWRRICKELHNRKDILEQVLNEEQKREEENLEKEYENVERASRNKFEFNEENEKKEQDDWRSYKQYKYY